LQCTLQYTQNALQKAYQMAKHTLKDKMDFNNRLMKIWDKLPENFINLVLEKLPEASANRIINVRYNRSVDFDILKALEEISEKFKEKVTQ
jgi:hypothetical protein